MGRWGGRHSDSLHTAPSFLLCLLLARGWRTSKGRLAKFFPFSFLCLGNQGCPASSQRPHSGLCSAPGHHQRCLGVGRESRWAPSQPEVAKQLPLLQKILMRKGLLISKCRGPFLCSSGSAAQTRGCGWLKVTWLIGRRGQGRDLTYVHSLKDSEGATGHNSMEPAPTGMGHLLSRLVTGTPLSPCSLLP